MSTTVGPLIDRPNNFDALRLLAAVTVILAHAYPLSRPGAPDPLGRLGHGHIGLGPLAVYVFFAISGYLITMSCDRSRSPRAFLARRVARLYPGFAVALAVCFFIVTPLAVAAPGVIPFPRQAAKWIAYSLCLNEYSDANAFANNALPSAVNGSLWTIKYEFACYMLVLAIALLGGLRRTSILCVATIAVVLAHVARSFQLFEVHHFHVAFIRVLPGPMLGWTSTFLIGGICWVERARFRYRPAVAAGAVALLIVAALPRNSAPFESLLPIALPYVVLTLAFAPCRWAEGFATRVRGDYSYGTYLYAFPIQQLVTAGFGGTMSPALNFWIAAPLAVLCGIASWHGVEKHFVRRDRRERRATIVPEARAAGGRDDGEAPRGQDAR